MHCSPSAFGLLLHRNRSLASYRQQACPPQRLREPGERASGNVQPRALQPQRLWPTPASQPQPCPLIGSRPALRSACGSLGREPLERAARALQPQRLWHTPASQAQPCPLIGSRPALRSACKPLPAAFGLLLHRSLALFLFSAASGGALERASLAPMGFQKRR